MEDLIIVDYNSAEVHFYKIPADMEVTDEVLDALGHRGKDCYWMAGNIKTVNHKKVINPNKLNIK